MEMMDGGANCLIIDVRGHNEQKKKAGNDPSDNGLELGDFSMNSCLA